MEGSAQCHALTLDSKGHIRRASCKQHLNFQSRETLIHNVAALVIALSDDSARADARIQRHCSTNQPNDIYACWFRQFAWVSGETSPLQTQLLLIMKSLNCSLIITIRRGLSYTYAKSCTPGSPGLSIRIRQPGAIATDPSGNIYFADTTANAVRVISVLDGTVSTVAGTCGVGGFSGNGGLATSALLSSPVGLTFTTLPAKAGSNLTAATTLYLTSPTNNNVRYVQLWNGVIYSFAGNKDTVATRDNINLYNPAWLQNSFLNAPISVAADSKNNVYILDRQCCVWIVPTFPATTPRVYAGR